MDLSTTSGPSNGLSHITHKAVSGDDVSKHVPLFVPFSSAALGVKLPSCRPISQTSSGLAIIGKH